MCQQRAPTSVVLGELSCHEVRDIRAVSAACLMNERLREDNLQPADVLSNSAYFNSFFIEDLPLSRRFGFVSVSLALSRGSGRLSAEKSAR